MIGSWWRAKLLGGHNGFWSAKMLRWRDSCLGFKNCLESVVAAGKHKMLQRLLLIQERTSETKSSSIRLGQKS